MTAIVWILTLLSSFIGATYVLASKLLAQDINPISLTFLRIAIACLSFLPFIKIKTFKQLQKIDLYILILAGISGIFLTNILYFKSLETISALNAALINALVPLLMLIIASIYLRKIPRIVQLIAYLLGFLGVMLMITKYHTFSISALISDSGNMIMLLSVFFWVIYSMLAQYKTDSVSSEAFTFGALLCGLIPLAPLGTYYGLISLVQRLSVYEWFLLLYISIITTSFGYFLYAKSIQKIGPEKASFIVYNTTPLFVMILSYALYNESITTQEWIGSLCILVSLAIEMRSA